MEGKFNITVFESQNKNRKWMNPDSQEKTKVNYNGSQ